MCGQTLTHVSFLVIYGVVGLVLAPVPLHVPCRDSIHKQDVEGIASKEWELANEPLLWKSFIREEGKRYKGGRLEKESTDWLDRFEPSEAGSHGTTVYFVPIKLESLPTASEVAVQTASEVAVKLIKVKKPNSLARKGLSPAYIQNEAQMMFEASRLLPNDVINVFDAYLNNCSESAVLIMERMRVDMANPSLYTVRQDTIAGRMLRMLQIIAKMHSHGFVHGDVKPDNFFMDFNRGIKLGDLGSTQRYVARFDQFKEFPDESGLPDNYPVPSPLSFAKQFAPPEFCEESACREEYARSDQANKLSYLQGADVYQLMTTFLHLVIPAFPHGRLETIKRLLIDTGCNFNFCSSRFMNALQTELDGSQLGFGLRSMISHMFADMCKGNPEKRLTASQLLKKYGPWLESLTHGGHSLDKPTSSMRWWSLLRRRSQDPQAHCLLSKYYDLVHEDPFFIFKDGPFTSSEDLKSRLSKLLISRLKMLGCPVDQLEDWAVKHLAAESDSRHAAEPSCFRLLFSAISESLQRKTRVRKQVDEWHRLLLKHYSTLAKNPDFALPLFGQPFGKTVDLQSQLDKGAAIYSVDCRNSLPH